MNETIEWVPNWKESIKTLTEKKTRYLANLHWDVWSFNQKGVYLWPWWWQLCVGEPPGLSCCSARLSLTSPSGTCPGTSGEASISGCGQTGSWHRGKMAGMSSASLSVPLTFWNVYLMITWPESPSHTSISSLAWTPPRPPCWPRRPRVDHTRPFPSPSLGGEDCQSACKTWVQGQFFPLFSLWISHSRVMFGS